MISSARAATVAPPTQELSPPPQNKQPGVRNSSGTFGRKFVFSGIELVFCRRWLSPSRSVTSGETNACSLGGVIIRAVDTVVFKSASENIIVLYTSANALNAYSAISACMCCLQQLLVEAAGKGRLEEVQRLSDQGANLEGTDSVSSYP